MTRIAKRKLPIMHSTSSALVEHIDHQTDQQPAMTRSVPTVQSIHPIVRTRKVRDAGYHFSFTASENAGSTWHIVNGRGVPDDTLTAFARQLASATSIEQAQMQLAPLLSYLSGLARRGLLWYMQPSDLRAAWQEYLRRSAPCWQMAGGEYTALVVSAGQGRDLRALHSALAQFYTFAIVCQTYAYQHPFAGQGHLVCLFMPARLRRLIHSSIQTSSIRL
jgi:hypothetical protein